jgi:hypothetical protein
MTRIAAALAVAVLGSGCIINTTDNGEGSVNLYWDFVRNAPAQPGGYVVYDADLIGSGNSSCPESGVEVVEVRSPTGTISVSCTYGGVQGLTFDNVREGTQSFRVRGWRSVGGTDRLVFEHTVVANVLGGSTIDVFADVEPVRADIDLVAYFSYGPGQYYATCNEALNPVVAYDLFDSLGTLIDSAGNVPCGPGASAFPLTVILDTLDLDTYSIRLKGYTGAPQVRTFDSCTSNALKYLAFDHFATHTGAGAIEVDLFTPPACTEL